MFARQFSLRNLSLFRNYISLKPIQGVITMCTQTLVSAKDEVPKQPRRPSSAFLRFAIEKRNEHSRIEPKIGKAEVYLRVAALWKSMTDEERKPYMDAYIKEIFEYRTLEERWWSSLTVEQKQNYIQNGPPERKETHIRKKIIALKRLNNIPYLKHMETWNSMSDEEKKPYFDASRSKFKENGFAYYAWELRMMKQGQGDLIRQVNKLRNEIRSEKSKRRKEEDKVEKLV